MSNVTYYGIERLIIETWEPCGIVGAPDATLETLKTLRNIVFKHDECLRVSILESPNAAWTPIIADKRVIDINSFLIALRIL